ncbi:alpha/beta fold hydrolase [Paenibacillus harenae]|uniref:alpha/beta fold hydrolase n=1 Tax=Paenibacillus harenae TaxID=306543 RepID=UPI002791C6FE|nr:alpha/beta hydrolase [Paenibacillus harenae]MDQ0061467.1 pimeloyl-ACP methyl ester carboxylesterase [Paenibacillus harenae]
MDWHYAVQGQGKPIVMIHGGGCDSRDWSYLAPQLANKYQVITFDARGCGQSPPPTETVNYVTDVACFLDNLSIDKAVLIGHSLGGQIATEFALAYPERVQELVLIAPTLGGFVQSPDVLASFQAIQEAAPDIAKMTELVVTSSSYSVIKDSPLRELLHAMTDHNIRILFGRPSFNVVWPTPPAIERLHELRAKTLFVRGTRDHEDNVKIEKHFRKLENTRFVAIEGGDHMLNLTHADMLYPEIVAFLGE